MADPAPRIVGPKDGVSLDLAGFGIRFMIAGDDSGGSFSLVEHPLAPRRLAAPMHRHKNEDEYSYVLHGRLGAKLGDEVVFGEPGDLVFKPRGQWHTFWNAGDEPASILEILSPAGFERYFEELGELMSGAEPPTPEQRQELAARYDLEVDPNSLPELCREHGLSFPGVD